MSAPQPLLVVTDWGTAGAAPVAALLAAVGVASMLYWRAIRRRETLPLRTVLALAAIGAAIAWFSPVLFSSDVYAYAAYGEMARLGLNPYAHPPSGIADPIVRAAQLQWITAFPICVYGPAFVAFAEPVVATFARFGPLAPLDAFRIAACLGLLVCSALAFYAYSGDRQMRLRAAATIGLNPVAIWCAVEGHNDALALAIVLAGFVIARRWPGTGAAVVALSSLLKPPGVAAALGLAIVQPRARFGATIGIVLAAAGSIPLLTGITRQLAPHGHYAPQASLQAALAPLGTVAALAITVTVAFVLAARGGELLRRSDGTGWIWLGLGAWVVIPNPYPWYGVWLLALAALGTQTRAGAVAIALSFTSLLRYVPDATGTPNGLLSAMLGVAAALPLLGLIPLRARTEYNERFV